MQTLSHPDIQALCAEESALATATASVPLGCATREVWVRAALGSIGELLDDHAQCELKAASNAIAILGRHPERNSLVRRMSSLSKEEMLHYRMVRQVLLDRGGRPTRPTANPYLKAMGRDRLGGPWSLLDDLLVCALVEARSCERFVALSRGLRSMVDLEVAQREELATFYERLARSESGHAHVFVALAEEYFALEKVREELVRRSGIEATALETLPVTPRMHGGHRRV